MVRLLKAVSVLTLSVVLLSGCSAGWPAAAPTAFPSVSAKPGDVVKPNFAYRVAYEDQWLRIVNDSPLDRYKVPRTSNQASIYSRCILKPSTGMKQDTA